MSPDCTSTSVTLLYEEQPVLNFVAFVDGLEQALRETEHSAFRVTWDHEDLATIDIDGSRVALGMSRASAEERAAGGFACALVLAVGPVPDQPEGTPCPLADSAAQFCTGLQEQIEGNHHADLVLWADTAGPFTAAHFDSLVETALTMRRDETLDSAAQRFDAPEVEALLDRMGIEMDRRAREREEHEAAFTRRPEPPFTSPLDPPSGPPFDPPRRPPIPRRPVRHHRRPLSARPVLPVLDPIPHDARLVIPQAAPEQMAETMDLISVDLAHVDPQSVRTQKLRSALYPDEAEIAPASLSLMQRLARSGSSLADLPARVGWQLTVAMVPEKPNAAMRATALTVSALAALVVIFGRGAFFGGGPGTGPGI